MPFGSTGCGWWRPADLADTAWGNAGGYDPGWAYHGLLAGTPGDAVRFLHALMSGDVLPPALLAEMRIPHPVGGPWPGRPFVRGGYGLGLMIGEIAGETSSAGNTTGSTTKIATGHSGAGPGSVAAVYHFGGLTPPCTVAAFAQGDQEGIVEREAVRLAWAG
jgi:D-alanyl-D-alanine carboxypeptidase